MTSSCNCLIEAFTSKKENSVKAEKYNLKELSVITQGRKSLSKVYLKDSLPP